MILKMTGETYFGLESVFRGMRLDCVLWTGSAGKSPGQRRQNYWLENKHRVKKQTRSVSRIKKDLHSAKDLKTGLKRGLHEKVKRPVTSHDSETRLDHLMTVYIKGAVIVFPSEELPTVTILHVRPRRVTARR